MSEVLLKLLSFYGALGRPLTFLEIWRLLPEEKRGSALQLWQVLDDENRKGKIISKDNFFVLKKFGPLSNLHRRPQDFLLDKKWRKLLCLRRWFKYIPFLDFVMASGSMALGNVNENSDFDVLLGVKSNRIFTVRYLTLFIFSILGARRLDDEEGSSPDKLCFNHFVTRESFSKPPHNRYRSELYRSMIPILGKQRVILDFLKANEWANTSVGVVDDLRFESSKNNLFRALVEWFLSGSFGDFTEEKIFAPIAKRRLVKYIKEKGDIGRSVLSDNELEFHFDLGHEEGSGALLL